MYIISLGLCSTSSCELADNAFCIYYLQHTLYVFILPLYAYLQPLYHVTPDFAKHTQIDIFLQHVPPIPDFSDTLYRNSTVKQ